MKITFEGLTSDWHTAYADAGIVFSGGTLDQVYGNHYIVGETIMTFNPALALREVTFRGDARGPDNFIATFVKGQFYEPVLFESGSWTPTGHIPGWYPGMMFSGRAITEGLVDEIHFNGLIALDDIEFSDAASSAVPEPTTFALVLIATAILTWSRRHVRIPSQA